MPANKVKHYWGSQTSIGIAGLLQKMQNIIVVGLCLIIFWIMLVQMYQTSLETLGRKNFRDIAGHLIYIFVLVELFRLLIYYLEEQRILLSTIIEVTIVSMLREVILEGILTISWERVLALCGLLLTLGAIMYLHHSLVKDRPKLEQITIPRPSAAEE
ncbi:MAG: phosphate-starvation-inducible PsiE family protein [Desulfobacca sp.]|uniref:phosphate-starvation-inducible PsiE family protein n=1 Tax=Desulfobacca sp. TaxID=2067990 RepID=UPI00404A78B5